MRKNKHDAFFCEVNLTKADSCCARIRPVDGRELIASLKDLVSGPSRSQYSNTLENQLNLINDKDVVKLHGHNVTDEQSIRELKFLI